MDNTRLWAAASSLHAQASPGYQRAAYQQCLGVVPCSPLWYREKPGQEKALEAGGGELLMADLAEQLAHVLDMVDTLYSSELAHRAQQCTDTLAGWLEATPMPLLVTDYWGNISAVNQAAAVVFKMRPQWLVRK